MCVCVCVCVCDWNMDYIKMMILIFKGVTLKLYPLQFVKYKLSWHLEQLEIGGGEDSFLTVYAVR